MFKRIFQFIGVAVLAGAVWLGVDYIRDPPFWQRWYDTFTHLESDYLNLKPVESIESDSPFVPQYAAVGKLSVEPSALRAAQEYAADFDSFALIVLHNDIVQMEWYADGWSRDRLTQSQSMMKTIAALMVGIALADGHIGSVDEPIGNYITERRDDPRGQISIKNLLRMSSGLAVLPVTLNPFTRSSSFRFLFTRDRKEFMLKRARLEWEPGSKFDYNDLNAQLAGMVVERAAGKPWADYLGERLWQPLGGLNAEVWMDRDGGTAMTACCLMASALDWAKVAMMMKNRGALNGAQIVPPGWIDEMLEPSPHMPGYGYFTWLGQGLVAVDKKRFPWAVQNEPLLASDIFILHGYGGQQAYVSREQDLVVVRMGPFAGMQPLKDGWDDSYLMNTIIGGVQKKARALPGLKIEN